MDEIIVRFLKVIELKNLSRAAEALGISQPALSQNMQSLEQKLGTELFTRDKTGIKPTQAGMLIHQKFQQVGNLYKNLKSELLALEKKQDEQIRMGMTDNVALLSLGKTLDRFHKKYPATEANIIVDNSSLLIDLVKTGKLDAAIITAQPNYRASELKTVIVGLDKLVLIGSSAMRGSFKSWSSLDNPRFYTYNRSSATFKLIDDYLHSVKVQPRYLLYSSSPHAILASVKAGEGYAFVPENLLSRKEAGVEVFSKYILTRKLWLIYRRDMHVSETKKFFFEMFREQLKG